MCELTQVFETPPKNQSEDLHMQRYTLEFYKPCFKKSSLAFWGKGEKKKADTENLTNLDAGAMLGYLQ